MAGSFADAYVQILPKMADFGAELKRALGGIKNVEVPVSLKFDPGKITQQLADLRKPIELSVLPVLDDAKAKGALTDLRKPVDISVTPIIDDVKARRALTDLDKPLDISVRPILEDSKVKGALADLQRAITVPLEVRLDGKARSELADLTKTETKIIEVDYVSHGGKDPYGSFSAAGTAAGEKAGGNITAGLSGALAGGMKGPAALLVGGLGLKAVVDSGGDFQVAMQKIQVQTGATAEQMAKVDAITLQLGKDQLLGAASAGDAAAAIQVLTKGQFSLEESLGIARSALQLSIVSNQDAATATGQLATAMAQLKVPVKDAAAVVDSLAAADLKGIIGNAQDYATAIQYAGTSWTQAFKNQEPLDRLYDLQTALVTLDNQAGITGSAAGTTIRRMMIDMTGPTEKAKTGIRELTEAFQKNGGVLRDGGSIFVTAAGQMRPLTESIDNLDLAFKNLNPQQVMDLLEPVFTTVGKEGVQLLRDGRDSWDDYRAAVMRSGLAQELADAQATGLKGAFAGLAGALETTAIQTAKAISPLLIPAISGIGTAISALGVVIPPALAGLQSLFSLIGNTAVFQTALDVFGRLKTIIDQVFAPPTETGSWVVNQFLAAQTPADNLRLMIERIRDAFVLVDRAATAFETSVLPKIQAVASFVTGTLIPAITSIATTVAGITGDVLGFFKEWDLKAKIAAGALASITAGIVATTVVLPAFTAAVTGSGIALGVLLSPVTLVVAGLTALAIGVKLAYDNFGPFHAAVDAVWQTMVKLPGPTWLAVAAIAAVGVAVTVATGPVGLIVLGVGALVAALTLLSKNTAVRDFVAQFAAFTGITSAIDGLKQSIRGIGEIVSGTVGVIRNVLNGNWSGAWAGAKRGVQGVIDLIIGINRITFAPLIGAIRAISSAFSGPMQAVSNFARMLATLTRRIVIDVVMNIPGAGLIQGAVARATGTRISNPTSPPRAGIIPGSLGTASNPVRLPARATGQVSGRAEGGPVQAGTPYIVGEEGPELFFPKVSGEIFTNTDSARLLKQAKQKSFDAAGIIAKVLVRTPGGVQGSPTDKTFATLTSSFNEIVTAVDQATTSIQDLAAGAVDFTDQVGRGASDFVAAVTDSVGDIVGDISASGNDLADNGKKIGQDLADNSKKIGQDLADNGKKFAEDIIGTAESFDDSIVDVVDGFRVDVVDAADDLAVKVGAAAGDIAADATTFGDNIGDVVIDYIVPAAQNIADALGENSPLDGAIEGVGTGLGDVSTGLGDLQTDLSAVSSSSVVLAFDTLSNVITQNLFPALDGFVAKLNAFDISSLGGGFGDPIPVTAVDSNGAVTRPDFIVPPPPGSQSNADNIPGSGGNPANTPGGTGGPLPYAVGDGVPGSGFNPNNTPGGGGGPISTAPVIPLPGPITNTLANGINSIFTAISQFIPNATLLDGRAAGGPVLRNRPYLVGERGPELFVPRSFGNIRTNAALMAADLEVSRSLSSGGGDVAERVAAAVKEALAEAGLDRPNLGGVYVNTEIPGWQIDTLVEELFDRIDQRMARGN